MMPEEIPLEPFLVICWELPPVRPPEVVAFFVILSNFSNKMSMATRRQKIMTS